MTVLGMAFLGLAAPASAAPQEQSTPVLGLVSWGGNAVAENGVLTIGPVQLTITGEARTVPFSVRLELDDEGSLQPFRFGNDGDDACHRPAGVTSGLVLDCRYAVPVDGRGGVSDVTLAPHVTITAITAASSQSTTSGGSVKLTVTGDVGGTLVGIRNIDLHRHAHLTAAVAGPISGHVGDIVDVPWTVTNTGPDELPGASGQVTLTAPSGTEWTGAAGAQCNQPVPKSKYICSTGVLLPGRSLSETWQLKIVSDTVGTGNITAHVTSPFGTPPNWVVTDPEEGQGSSAAINITVLSGPPATGSPAPAPSGPALPVTGMNFVAVVGAGLLAIVLGAILLVAARRRRAISKT